MIFPSIAWRHSRRTPIPSALVAVLLSAAIPASGQPAAKQEMSHANTVVHEVRKPAVPGPASLELPESVSLVRPRIEFWPDQIDATGNVMPWQESHVGTEVGGLRLVSVQANVGDVVRKGQVLARLNASTVETELESARAQLAEAQAALAQAVATLERANRLAPAGGVSQQELTLYETQKHTAEARLSAARAQVKKQQLRLEFATLVAPDDGIISSSSAAEGTIVQSGSELFRLIRQGRLEWRAEVKGETLLKLVAGQDVTVHSPLGSQVKGRVRQVSPTIDLKTGDGLAYVDLPAEANLKAGLRVSGTLTIGKRKVLLLPASAVLQQEGVSSVFRVHGGKRVESVEVKTGQTRDSWVEIVGGLDDQAVVIANDVDVRKVAEYFSNSESAAQPRPKKRLM